MCLILFAYKTHAEWPLILASNRDEAYLRPTRHAQFWDHAPEVLAGQDLDKGGTWLGMSKGGRIAAVTNFRLGQSLQNYPKSRGHLVDGFLQSQKPAVAYLHDLAMEKELYAGFGCLLGDLNGLYFYSNRAGDIQAVEPGVHGLSNAFLNTPWPKVVQGKEELSSLVGAPLDFNAEALFEMLADQKPFDHEHLPNTGIDFNRERALSAKFIAVDERYGTRSSTVIMVHQSGRVHYAERSFGPWGVLINESKFCFELKHAI